MRKFFVNLIILLWMLGPCTVLAGKLYVFYPTEARPNIIQEKISVVMPENEVIAFGRYKDFTTLVETTPPDAVITKPELVKQLPGFTIVSKGSFNGKTENEFVLLTIDTPLKKSEITTEITIGALDFLGRKEMEDFLYQFVPGSPKIKRVTKLEDLLPLLTFNMARAIIISDREVQYFKKTSNLNFVVSTLPEAKAGIVVFAIKEGGDGNSILKKLKSMGQDGNALLDIQEWK